MICYKPSFPPPDQAEGDIKDTIYQTTGIAHTVILRESFTPSFPIHRESPFCKNEIPNQVGNDIVDKFQCDSGSEAGMTEGLRMKALTRPPIRPRVTLRIRFINCGNRLFHKDEVPNQVENDSFVIFIVILTHIMS